MLGSSALKQVTNYKYLGVTLCSNLSWNLHVQNISFSAFRKLCFLKYKLKHAPSSVKLLAYYYLIRPKLEYACIIWDPYTQCNIKKLERIQRQAIRFVYNKFSTFDSPTELMRSNNIPTLESRRKKLRLDFLSQLLNNKLALDPALYVSLLVTRPTRQHHQNDLTPYFSQTNLFKYSFFPRTINDWNDLPL